MATPELGFRDCVAVTVFRELVRTLQESPALNGRIKRWAVWDGQDDSVTPPGDGELPFVALVPSVTADRWYGPQGFQAKLVVTVTGEVSGYDADDGFNLYRDLVHALYEGDARTVEFKQRIGVYTAAGGATTGEILASGPDVRPVRVAGKSGGSSAYRMRVVFQLRIDIQETWNV